MYHHITCLQNLPKPSIQNQFKGCLLCNWPENIVSGQQSSHCLHLLSLLLRDADTGLVRARPTTPPPPPRPPPTTSCCVSLESTADCSQSRIEWVVSRHRMQDDDEGRREKGRWEMWRRLSIFTGHFDSSVHLCQVLTDCTWWHLVKCENA